MWPREAKDGRILCPHMLLTKYGAVASSAELISGCCCGRLVRISLLMNVDKKNFIILILLLQVILQWKYDDKSVWQERRIQYQVWIAEGHMDSSSQTGICCRTRGASKRPIALFIALYREGLRTL